MTALTIFIDGNAYAVFPFCALEYKYHNSDTDCDRNNGKIC